MASAWGKPGAWAQDVEETETETETAKPKASDNNVESEGDFPSLAAAMAAKPKKNKNKTATKLSLAEFTTGVYIGPGARAKQTETKGLTTDEMLMLPTGPRERTAEELERERSGGLGGSFRSYGRDRDRGSDTRERGRESGFDTDEPSRADSSSHWGSSKFTTSSSFGKGERDKEGPSRADGADDWGAGKKFTPSSDRKFGDGLGFGESGHSRADEVSNWAAQKQQTSGPGFDSYTARRGSGGGRSGFDFFNKDNGGPEGDRWSRRDGKENGGGGSGGGRPRLVLQPRTAPLDNSSSLSLGETGVRSKGSNPFGEAKPREQVLEEKGMDWKKIDEDLESRGRRDAGNADLVGMRSNVSQADDRTERNWRKRNDDANSNRTEETLRAASGDDSSHTESKHLDIISNQSDESDDSGGLVKNEKIEQLGNDLSQKVHISQENSNTNGYNRVGRW